MEVEYVILCVYSSSSQVIEKETAPKIIRCYGINQDVWHFVMSSECLARINILTVAPRCLVTPETKRSLHDILSVDAYIRWL